MPRIMADNDVRGQLDAILRFLQHGDWQPFWEDAAIVAVDLTSLKLSADTPDNVIWNACQANQIVLFTGNRNLEGPDSLEQAIRLRNGAESLPVVTLADPIRFKHDELYAENAAFKLLDYLLDLDKYRGAGCLYVP